MQFQSMTHTDTKIFYTWFNVYINTVMSNLLSIKLLSLINAAWRWPFHTSRNGATATQNTSYPTVIINVTPLLKHSCLYNYIVQCYLSSAITTHHEMWIFDLYTMWPNWVVLGQEIVAPSWLCILTMGEQLLNYPCKWILKRAISYQLCFRC